MNEFSKQQNNFDTRLNNFDLRLNTQDNKILFLSQQIEHLKNEMSKLGQQAAKNVNVKEIVPEPLPGEEEFLKAIVEGKLPELEVELRNVKRKCISGIIDAGLDAALSMYKFKTQYDKKEKNGSTI